jgi:hypothetical protein
MRAGRRPVVERAAPAIATPAASATSWQNAFDVSIRARPRRPEHRDPGLGSASATPAASGASGPTTTSSTRSRGPARRRPRSSGSTPRRARAARARSPSLPGATTTSLTPGSAASFQASACSRPPPPTTRIRVGITEAHAAHAAPPPLAHRPPRPLDRLGPLRPDRHEHDRDPGLVLERRDVARGVLRQVGQRADVVDRLAQPSNSS